MLYRLSGIFLIIWSMVNTYVDIREYGWSEGNYFWFCNLALFGMGVGLLIKSRGVLTGFLSIASFTQTFWLIDNIYRQTQSKSLFGLTDFMYRPGYPIEKFVLSHYHYFTLIIGCYALCFLPKEKNKTLILSAIFNPLIFLVSYFAFGESQNVNCIHSSCLPGLIEGSGPFFSLGFWLGVFCIHLAIAHYMNLFFLHLKITPPLKKTLNIGFGLFLMIAVGFSVHDIQYRRSLPQFTCIEKKEEGITAQCLYTRPFDDESFLVTFELKNNGYLDKVCELSYEIEGSERVIEAKANLLVGTEFSATEKVRLPQKDMVLALKPRCSELDLREPASNSYSPR